MHGLVDVLRSRLIAEAAYSHFVVAVELRFGVLLHLEEALRPRHGGV